MRKPRRRKFLSRRRPGCVCAGEIKKRRTGGAGSSCDFGARHPCPPINRPVLPTNGGDRLERGGFRPEEYYLCVTAFLRATGSGHMPANGRGDPGLGPMTLDKPTGEIHSDLLCASHTRLAG